jgi:hypothetical protein
MCTRRIIDKLCSLENKYPAYLGDVNNAHWALVMCLEKILLRKLCHDSLLLTMVLLSYFSILFFQGAWNLLRYVSFSQLWYILVFFKLQPPFKKIKELTQESNT